MSRTGQRRRRTKETSIEVDIDLDGTGASGVRLFFADRENPAAADQHMQQCFQALEAMRTEALGSHTLTVESSKSYSTKLTKYTRRATPRPRSARSSNKPTQSYSI